MKFAGLDCILLIDDDNITNFIHEKTISMSGIETHVQIVTSAREGLDFLSCKGKFSHEPLFPQPGIIFLDINMPVMTGWDFLEEYENLPETQKGKIVVTMLTTSENPEDQAKAASFSNIKTFYQKPLTVEMLMDIAENNF